jgi:O-succinylbenzoate synthase
MRLAGPDPQHRSGLLLGVGSGARMGWGEIAPLPGFSRHGLSACEGQCRKLADVLLGLPVQTEWQYLSGALQALHRQLHMPFSAVRLGLEMALLELLELRGLTALPGPAAARHLVRITPLLQGDAGRLPGLAAALDSPEVVKLKVARRPLAEEIALVERLCDLLPGHCRLRLDANRGWSHGQALAFLRSIPTKRIEFIEEPTPEPDDFATLYEASGVPYALDETLQDQHYHWQARPGLGSLVLKPTLAGGAERCALLAQQAARRGIPSVVSASYESALGMDFLRRLAARVQPGGWAGLDTLSSFRGSPWPGPGRANTTRLWGLRR